MPFSTMSRRAFGAAAATLLHGGASAAGTESPQAGTDDDWPLSAAFPRLAAVLPRATLTRLPTPVERAERLGEALSLSALFVKRDDISASPYGGGKPRKLELYLGEALALGRRRVATIGGVNSNHTLATALYAAKLGLGATLLLLPEPPGESVSRKLGAASAAGATLQLVPSQAAAERELARLGAPGSDVHAIPMGGTSPLGNVGFVNAALELMAQIRAGELPEPERIYVPLGTMGSAVGLLVGLTLAGSPSKLVAVRASNPGTSTLAGFRRQFARTVEFLRAQDPAVPALAFPSEKLTLEGGFLGAGYGARTRAGERALELARTTQGLTLEPTYSAKALAALVHAAPDLGTRPVLFWLTHSAAEPAATAAVETLSPALRRYVRAR